MSISRDVAPPSSRLRDPARLCGLALIALGLLVIVGWIFDVNALKSILPGFISMKINTALGFSLAGGALVLVRRRHLAPVATLLASGVALIGLLNLVQYAAGVDLGIDQLLIRDASPGPYPGRLAPVTALDFTACGIALALLAYGRRIVFAQSLALLAAFSAFLAVIGYAFGVPLLYGSLRYTSMALHTGLGCLILAVGLLAARPGEGLMQVLTSTGPGGWMMRRLVPSLLLLPSLLGFIFVQLSGLLGDMRLTLAMIVVALVVLFLVIISVLAHSMDDSERRLRRAVAETHETKKALSRSEELLRQSQKMEAIGQLAAGIAHDFNNLLAVIIGYCELLLFRANLSPDDRTRVQRINTAGETAAALTRQLLAFSRQQMIQPVPLDWNEVITRFEGMLQRLLKEHVQLSVSLDPGLPAIHADKGQMEQIIMNLAVNASDAMPDGGKLTIETRRVTLSAPEAEPLSLSAGEHVLVSVADNGSGMPPEVQEHIFEPFFTTKPVGKGTGLGLATVFGIVKQSGGGIAVESAPGEGTRFRLYFPAIEKAEPAVAAPVVVTTSLKGARILIVEDAEAISSLLEETLRAHGYEVLTAHSGAEGINLCRREQGRIHLVLTDVIMPEMSGREMVAQLQAICPEAKVVFMSGYTNDVVVRYGVFNSDVGFLQKPFTPRQLVQKVNEVLALS